jgi:hypothetical protein
MESNNVVDLDDYRDLEEIIKTRLGAHHVVVAAVMPDGNYLTFIPSEIFDMDLVYLIQTLSDRRKDRLM